MENVEKAIEATGTIDAQRRLVLDEPLPVVGPILVIGDGSQIYQLL